MTCKDCPLLACIGADCKKVGEELAKAQAQFLELAKDIPQLRGVLPQGSLLNAPKVESGYLVTVKEREREGV